jgi:putative NADH-flavin reductase
MSRRKRYIWRVRILVFGASGKTGREILHASIDAGHTITAFVRDPARLPATGARLIVGNVRDAAAVDAAVPGHDAVISALGVNTPLKADPDVVAGIRHIVNATRKHGVNRFLYLSFIGVSESRSAVGFVLRYVAPIPLRHEIADHEAKEAIVRSSGLDWTIVRPPKLTMGSRTGRYRSGVDIATWNPIPTLSRADVAHFIVDELTQPRFVRQAPRLLPA